MKNNWLLVVGIIIGIFIISWYIIYFIKIIIKEKEILKIKHQIDNLELNLQKQLAGTFSKQDYLDKLIAKKEKPLRNKMGKLQMERQFMLDKLPIIGFFKK